MSSRGKLVRLEQPRQVLLKSVPDEVSIRGKDVRPVQLYQAREKLVPADVSMSGKLVISAHSRQNFAKSVTAP